MQKARDRTFVRRRIVLSRLVDTRFQVLFTPLAGVLFAFPSRYWFTIGHQVVCSLGRWSSRIPTGLHVSRCTQDPARPLCVSLTGLSPALAGLSRPFSYTLRSTLQSYNPAALGAVVWASPRSLATTSGISVLISFPEGTEMFQFPSFATPHLCIQRGATQT